MRLVPGVEELVGPGICYESKRSWSLPVGGGGGGRADELKALDGQFFGIPKVVRQPLIIQ